MRRAIPLLVAIFTIAFSGRAFGQWTSDGFKQTVVNSEHDLRAASTGGTAVCEYCHVPHKLAALTPEPPLLWNQSVTGMGPYSLYASPTFNGSASVRDPSGASSLAYASYYSLLCLTCHDGAVAIGDFQFNEDYGDGPILGTAINVTPPDITAGGLANDHPVDFIYSAALATADGGVKSPLGEGAGAIPPYIDGTKPLPLFKDTSADTTGRMECATCHNPHDDTQMPFLRISNAASGLCLTCHGQ